MQCVCVCDAIVGSSGTRGKVSGPVGTAARARPLPVGQILGTDFVFSCILYRCGRECPLTVVTVCGLAVVGSFVADLLLVGMKLSSFSLHLLLICILLAWTSISGQVRFGAPLSKVGPFSGGYCVFCTESVFGLRDCVCLLSVLAVRFFV